MVIPVAFFLNRYQASASSGGLRPNVQPPTLNIAMAEMCRSTVRVTGSMEG